MKSPVVLVTLALTMAILLAASLLIATGTRGEDALWPLAEHPASGGHAAARSGESDRRRRASMRETPLRIRLRYHLIQ